MATSFLRWKLASRGGTRSFITASCLPPPHVHSRPSPKAFQIPSAKDFIPFVIGQRTYQHLSPQPPSSPSAHGSGAPAPDTTPNPPAKRIQRDVSVREQRRKDWAIIKRLLIHIWPPNDWSVRGRVVFGMGLLVLGKVRYCGKVSRVGRDELTSERGRF